MLKINLSKKYKRWDLKESNHIFITDTKDRLLYYWDWDNKPMAWKRSTWGPDKTIYDLPILNTIQEKYLSELGILNKNIDITNNIKEQEVDLFVALWSLNESPVILREQILEKIKFKEWYYS